MADESIKDLERISELAKLSEFELVDLVHSELVGEKFLSGQESDEQKRKRVNAWLEDNLHIIQKTICRPELKFLRSEPSTGRERLLLIFVVGDCLSGAIIGLSPFTAAALLLAYGLDRICRPSET